MYPSPSPPPASPSFHFDICYALVLLHLPTAFLTASCFTHFDLGLNTKLLRQMGGCRLLLVGPYEYLQFFSKKKLGISNLLPNTDFMNQKMVLLGLYQLNIHGRAEVVRLSLNNSTLYLAWVRKVVLKLLVKLLLQVKMF